MPPSPPPALEGKVGLCGGEQAVPGRQHASTLLGSNTTTSPRQKASSEGEGRQLPSGPIQMLKGTKTPWVLCQPGSKPSVHFLPRSFALLYLKQQEELPGGVEPGKIRYHSMPIDIRWRVLRSSFHSVAWPCTFKSSSGAEFVVAQKGRCPILFRCKAQGRLAIAMRCMHRGKRRGRARSKRAPHHGPLPFLGESELSAVSETPIVGANALFATISTWEMLVVVRELGTCIATRSTVEARGASGPCQDDTTDGSNNLGRERMGIPTVSRTTAIGIAHGPIGLATAPPAIARSWCRGDAPVAAASRVPRVRR